MSVNAGDGTHAGDVARAADSPPGAAGERAVTPGPRGRTHLRIRSDEAGAPLDLGELWSQRELLYFLVWRDVKVRYKQTLMGAAWVLVQPFFTMLVFTAVFHRLGGFRSDGLPYPLFAYAGLLLWVFFSQAVTNATHSLVVNSALVTKVYFPRMYVPAAAVGAGLVDLAVASALLAGLLVYYGVEPTWRLLLAPLYVLLTVALALGLGLLTSAVTVKYRDVRHALPFLIQLLLFASPVIYPLSVVPEKWHWAAALNPLAGVLEGFRASIAGRPVDLQTTAVSIVSALVLLALSAYVFRRFEGTFADLI
jgi:lipopolysaccharide transport system permease protein